MNQKFDVTSTAVEKGLDMAKGFLDKLIMPAVEEVGLLAKDQITLWRFNQQIKMLNKSKVYCDKHNINPKTISLKLLCPLLDYSGLEEDVEMQDKWSVLLGNMVDSEQNVENHVFPYILSQISKHEYSIIEKATVDQKNRITKELQELENFLADKIVIENMLADVGSELVQKEKELELEGMSGPDAWDDTQDLKDKKWDLQSQINNLDSKIGYRRRSLLKSEQISEKELQEFEISNLIRLGLVKEVRELLTNSQSLEIPNDPDKRYLVVDFEIEVETEDSFVITELGELFIEACSEKSVQ